MDWFYYTHNINKKHNKGSSQCQNLYNCSNLNIIWRIPIQHIHFNINLSYKSSSQMGMMCKCKKSHLKGEG